MYFGLASHPIFAVRDCVTLESCLRFPPPSSHPTPVATRDAIYERPLTNYKRTVYMVSQQKVSQRNAIMQTLRASFRRFAYNSDHGHGAALFACLSGFSIDKWSTLNGRTINMFPNVFQITNEKSAVCKHMRSFWGYETGVR